MEVQASQCPACAETIEGSPAFCPYCGQNLSRKEAVATSAKPFPRQLWLAGGFIGIALMTLVAVLILNDDASPTAFSNPDVQPTVEAPGPADACIETVNTYLDDMTDGEGHPTDVLLPAEKALGRDSLEFQILFDTYSRLIETVAAIEEAKLMSPGMTPPDGAEVKAELMLGVEAFCEGLY